jgi:hypothetical protein
MASNMGAWLYCEVGAAVAAGADVAAGAEVAAGVAAAPHADSTTDTRKSNGIMYFLTILGILLFKLFEWVG